MHPRLYPFASVIIFGLLYLYTAIGVFVVLLLNLLGIKRPVRNIFRLWAKSVFFVMGKKFPVYGLHNIQKQEKYILVANHSSLFDIVAITSFYPGISWFGHERLLKIPVFRRILKMIDYVPFSEPTYRNTRRMIEQLSVRAAKNTIAIFPEGTRTLNGKINPFYKGFIYLYRTTDLKILPVTLNAKNRNYIDFGSRLDIVVHRPIARYELDGKSDLEIIDTVRDIIQSAYKIQVPETFPAVAY